MPVSLERLMVELEPNVITDTLTRDCIQIQGGDPDAAADKKKSMRFREVEVLAFSFRSIAVINNLRGLDNLTKLQLDNNQITKIENLGHLSSLTWLDLSFNKIAVIEGLEALTKLVDLSLFNNRISKIEGLNTLTALNVLSLGNNALAALDNVMYLRQFKCLRLVNLAGNAICKEHDYRSYVLSHVKGLTYLDYRRVAAADVQSASEQHQDEMIEIQEREEQAQSEAKLAGERALHNGLMKEANLDGVETLIEDMVREDPEWARLTQVPGLTDPWNDIRDKFTAATDEFKLLILDAHARKKAEHAEWTAAVAGVLGQHDADAQEQVRDYERLKKKTIRSIQENPADSDPKTLVLGPKVKLLTLKDGLLDVEMEVVELLAGLLQEFDRNYSEIADANKALYNAYFTQVRDLQNTFFNQLSTLAITLYDKYNQENSDVDSLPEEARLLLQDKDGLSNALQASHDSHMSRIDGLEDRLVGTELRGANELTSKNVGWASTRNRGRVTEIINYIERNMAELDELAGEEEAGDA